MAHESPRIVEIAIVGAGPAGLMAADCAARTGARVTVYDAMPTAGRKFLMAGRSGLNITHAEDFDRFVARYGAAADWLRPLLEAFPPEKTRKFCAELGIETFVGTSGRVFPTAMKASPLLRAWLRRLADAGVRFQMRSRLADLAPDEAGGWRLTFETGAGRETIRADAVVLALGGASWPKLGSTGAWTDLLAQRGVAIAPFRPSNCGVEIAWSAHFLSRFEGAPIKPAAFRFGARSARGEAVVTKRGLEGGPVYALSADIGAAIDAGESARLVVDLKPDQDEAAIAARLSRRRKADSLSNALRKTIGLSPVAVALLREAGDVAQDDAHIAARVKACALPVRATAGLARAISTAGGVALAEVDSSLMLEKAPGVFLAGEMLDWDAPTGGYLLQACFATGAAAGEAAARHALGNAGVSDARTGPAAE